MPKGLVPPSPAEQERVPPRKQMRGEGGHFLYRTLALFLSLAHLRPLAGTFRMSTYHLYWPIILAAFCDRCPQKREIWWNVRRRSILIIFYLNNNNNKTKLGTPPQHVWKVAHHHNYILSLAVFFWSGIGLIVCPQVGVKRRDQCACSLMNF